MFISALERSTTGIDLCCVQEVRWRGASARFISGKD